MRGRWQLSEKCSCGGVDKKIWEASKERVRNTEGRGAGRSARSWGCHQPTKGWAFHWESLKGIGRPHPPLFLGQSRQRQRRRSDGPWRSCCPPCSPPEARERSRHGNVSSHR